MDGHDPASLCVNADEMHDSYLLSNSTFSSTFTWSESSLEGDVLWSEYIAPCQDFVTAAPTDVISPTLFEFITMKHTFWKGSLVYEFDMVSSAVHTGQLAFVVNYGVYTDPTDLNLAMAQYVQVFDLSSDCDTFKVSVPFMSTRPALFS
jgi:hypothetical protein